jgi:F0F1-type ATP synthase membrane subunit c/vacuolar-type H+-ATPase subunit K
METTTQVAVEAVSTIDWTLLGAVIAVVATGISATYSEAKVADDSLDALGKNPDLASALK